MATARQQTAPDSVKAKVQFCVNTGETPVSVVSAPGTEQQRQSGRFEEHEVVIHDGRKMADRLALDRDGFVLLRRPSAVTDFYDEAGLRKVYYPEMERLVAAATGAAKVVVFDHTIRLGDPAAQAARKVRGPVRFVHNDFTLRSAPQRVRDLLPKDEAEARLAKRFGSINVWRPIRGPVETAPLAICAYDSIDDADLIAAERRYDDRIGGIYQLAYNPKQRWTYFPRMTPDEVVLLKCFDSLTDGTARWTAHGAFDVPDPPPGAAPRESIEVRTLYFFD